MAVYLSVRRRHRLWFFLVVGVLGGALTVTTLLSNLSPGQKALGCLFYGAVCLAALATAVRSVRAGRSRAWAPRLFAGPYHGVAVRGVAFPLRITDRGARPWATVGIGAALLLSAGYILVTGRGVVGGGTGTKVVAIVLCTLFGLVLVLGGLGMRARPPAGDRMLVLTPDALCLPERPPLPWDAVAGFTRHSGGDFVDVLAAGGALLGRFSVSAVPDPRRLLATLDAALRDRAFRARLGEVEALVEVATRGATGGVA